MGATDGDQIDTLSGDPTLELPEFDSPPEDPLPLLERWLRVADERGVREPRALALATADAEGRPSNRILLLKQVTPALVFSRRGWSATWTPRSRLRVAEHSVAVSVRRQVSHSPTLIELDAEVAEEVPATEHRHVDRPEDRLQFDLQAVNLGHQSRAPDVMMGLTCAGVDGVLLTVGEVYAELRRPLLGEARGVRAAVGQGEERERATVGPRQPDRNRRLDRGAGDQARVGELARLRGSRRRQAPPPRRFVPGSAVPGRLVRAARSGSEHG